MWATRSRNRMCHCCRISPLWNCQLMQRPRFSLQPSVQHSQAKHLTRVPTTSTAQSKPRSQIFARNVLNHSPQPPSSSATPNSSTTTPSNANAAKHMLALIFSSVTATKPPGFHVRIAIGTQAPMRLPEKITSPNIYGRIIVLTSRVTIMVLRSSIALGPTVPSNNVRSESRANTQRTCVAFTTTLPFHALSKAVWRALVKAIFEKRTCSNTPRKCTLSKTRLSEWRGTQLNSFGQVSKVFSKGDWTEKYPVEKGSPIEHQIRNFHGLSFFCFMTTLLYFTSYLAYFFFLLSGDSNLKIGAECKVFWNPSLSFPPSPLIYLLYSYSSQSFISFLQVLSRSQSMSQ